MGSLYALITYVRRRLAIARKQDASIVMTRPTERTERRLVRGKLASRESFDAHLPYGAERCADLVLKRLKIRITWPVGIVGSHLT
jgi:hypothetical protein